MNSIRPTTRARKYDSYSAFITLVRPDAEAKAYVLASFINGRFKDMTVYAANCIDRMEIDPDEEEDIKHLMEKDYLRDIEHRASAPRPLRVENYLRARVRVFHTGQHKEAGVEAPTQVVEFRAPYDACPGDLASLTLKKLGNPTENYRSISNLDAPNLVNYGDFVYVEDEDMFFLTFDGFLHVTEDEYHILSSMQVNALEKGLSYDMCIDGFAYLMNMRDANFEARSSNRS